MDLNELEQRAARELVKFGLRGWTFGLANTRRRLGACRFRTRRIEIAEYYARNSPEESVVDTLLHEIAHAIAGAKAGHGPVWKAVAVRVGATPRACDTSRQAVMQPGPWQAECPACKEIVHLYRRPQSLTGYRCRCAARSPLLFEFMGDPARRPDVPLTLEEQAQWVARCGRCQTAYFRIRKPKPGAWRCRCSTQATLSWKFQPKAEGVAK